MKNDTLDRRLADIYYALRDLMDEDVHSKAIDEFLYSHRDYIPDHTQFNAKVSFQPQLVGMIQAVEFLRNESGFISNYETWHKAIFRRPRVSQLAHLCNEYNLTEKAFLSVLEAAQESHLVYFGTPLYVDEESAFNEDYMLTEAELVLFEQAMREE